MHTLRGGAGSAYAGWMGIATDTESAVKERGDRHASYELRGKNRRYTSYILTAPKGHS